MYVNILSDIVMYNYIIIYMKNLPVTSRIYIWFYLTISDQGAWERSEGKYLFNVETVHLLSSNFINTISKQI